jgi:hypothetical protein
MVNACVSVASGLSCAASPDNVESRYFFNEIMYPHRGAASIGSSEDELLHIIGRDFSLHEPAFMSPHPGQHREKV